MSGYPFMGLAVPGYNTYLPGLPHYDPLVRFEEVRGGF
jgi:hypothetical protein